MWSTSVQFKALFHTANGKRTHSRFKIHNLYVQEKVRWQGQKVRWQVQIKVQKFTYRNNKQAFRNWKRGDWGDRWFRYTAYLRRILLSQDVLGKEQGCVSPTKMNIFMPKRYISLPDWSVWLPLFANVVFFPLEFHWISLVCPWMISSFLYVLIN